ncbi:hypothetical protein IAT40_002115 [Kwoniella sp. CBS 6097]
MIPIAQASPVNEKLDSELSGEREELPRRIQSNDEISEEQYTQNATSQTRREWTAVKVVYAPQDGRTAASKPHDVVKEVELLNKLHHQNIIRLLAYDYDSELLRHRMTFPLYATTLSQLLQEPTFPFHPDSQASPPKITYDPTERSTPGSGQNASVKCIMTIIYSLLAAINHLHTSKPPIAHRDINPSNVMVDWDGSLKLGDFGTAWCSNRSDAEKKPEGDLAWVEREDNMCCDVGTGPYRAPELLFSPLRYDAPAIDLWATGCTIAQLFTMYLPLSTGDPTGSGSGSGSSSESSGPSDDDYDPLEHDIRPRPSDRDHNSQSSEGDVSDNDYGDALSGPENSNLKGNRKPLFEASFGSLGLAASIFRILGTPTSESWPSFGTLPDANKIEFPYSPPSDLVNHMPALDHMGNHAGAIKRVLQGLIVLDPSRRSSAQQALVMMKHDGWHSESPDIPGGESEEGREVLQCWTNPFKARYDNNR